MISFASLFVGFVLGIVNVQLLAGGGVDRVQLLLDGRPVAELRAPFSTPLDLGCEPSPHELVAVAYDAKGKELDRARQWINRPRPTAEASLVLEGGRGGTGRVAWLTWRALAGEVPASVAATFDGTPIPVSDPTRIELPPHEPARIHFLKAVVEFGKGVSATAELIFGGSRIVEAHSELTAVAVDLEEKTSLPPASEMTGWLEARGVPLEVGAVEAGGVDLVFVAEGSAWFWLRRTFKQESPMSGDSCRNPNNQNRCATESLRFRFLWPVGTMTAQSAMVTNVFPTSPWLTRKYDSIGAIASFELQWPSWKRGTQRIADAVAVAGLAAAEGNRQRAVVLLLGPDAKDGSLIAPEEAARFLQRIGVPLQVWSIGRKHTPEAKRWGAERLIFFVPEFEAATRHLLEAANRQRIVWVEGAHLPQAVTLTPLAKGIHLAQ